MRKSMALAKEDIVKNVQELSVPILSAMNLELVDVEYKRTGREALLRIFIDKQGGVTLDDCADFSRELSVILDVEDLIPCEYNLEVSSPGLDRPLKNESDYARFVGRLVKVRTYEPYEDSSGNKRKTFLGQLDGLENQVVMMTLKEGQKAAIPLDKVAKANLEFEF